MTDAIKARSLGYRPKYRFELEPAPPSRRPDEGHCTLLLKAEHVKLLADQDEVAIRLLRVELKELANDATWFLQTAGGTTPDRLGEIDARWDALPKGPWAWFGNTSGRSPHMYLATTWGGHKYVMDFKRWKFSGAMPRFQDWDRNIMVDASAIAEKTHKDYSGEMRGLDDPTAIAFAHSKEDIDWLRTELRRAWAEIDRLKGEASHADQA